MKSIIKIIAIATLLFGTSVIFTSCNNEDELYSNQQSKYWSQQNDETTPVAKLKYGWYGWFHVSKIVNGKLIEFAVWGFIDGVTGCIDISTIREIRTNNGELVDPIITTAFPNDPNYGLSFIVRDSRGNNDNDLHLKCSYDEMLSFFEGNYFVDERE